MSNRSDIDLIDDILICLSKIKSYISGSNYESFANDHKTQDAVIRNIEIIGEAVKKISNEIKSKYSNVPWQIIAGTRDRLIHDYFGVNIDIVWEIAAVDSIELYKELEKIKRDISG